MKKMNVLKGIILAAVCGFCIVPAAKADAKVIHIKTEDQLKDFAKGTSNYEGDTVYLDNDIKLKGNTSNWDSSRLEFRGTFDGQGHTISNLRMKSQGNAGFISGDTAQVLSGFVIKNLTIKDSKFESGQKNAGAFVGSLYYVGAQIINCHAESCVIQAAEYAGGIIGYMKQGYAGPGEIASCTVDQGCKLSGMYAGGIAGSVNDTAIYNCANYCSIDQQESGGIVYMMYSGKISNCLNTGNVKNGDIISNNFYTVSLERLYTLKRDEEDSDTHLLGSGVQGLSYTPDEGDDCYLTEDEICSEDFLVRLNENRPSQPKSNWLAWEFRSDNMFPVIAKCTDISGADVTLAADEVVYTGDPVKVAVSVKYNGQSLSENTDYELVYENNEEVGEATVRIQGTGLYMGEIIRTFTIKEENDLAKIADIRLEKTKYEYTGSEIKPEVTVTVDDEDEDLVEGQDYELVYEDNIEAGEATVTIKGIGKYEGEVVRTFMIEQSYIDLSEALVTLGQTSYEYTGSEIKPELTVTLDEENLTEGTDYKISYSNNIRVGQASVTVTGIGDYTGSITKNFTITEAPNKNTGSTDTGNNSTTNSTTNNTANTTGNTTGSTNTANQNTTQINSIVNAGISLTQVTYTYDGNEKKPSIAVTYAGRTLISGVDYDVKYSDNVNAGTAGVQVIGKGSYQGTCQTSFTIKKASQKITCGKITIKGRRGKAFSLKTKLTGDGKLTFKSLNSKIVKVTSKGKIILKKSGTVTILVKASGTGNYKAASKKVTLKVVCRAAR